MTTSDTAPCSTQEVMFRHACGQDIGAIAELHADNWRLHYRGAYLDSFLDGDVYADRREVWGRRLTDPDPGHFTIAAECKGDVVGFVHMILDADPRWGALLENLHVNHRLKRHGIGRRLVLEAARGLAERCPNDSGFYLWALDQNTAAQAFYAACGGTSVETTLLGPFPGGGQALGLRIVWPDAADLVSTLAPSGEVRPGRSIGDGRDRA